MIHQQPSQGDWGRATALFVNIPAWDSQPLFSQALFVIECHVTETVIADQKTQINIGFSPEHKLDLGFVTILSNPVPLF